jgi:hypothetical protein
VRSKNGISSTVPRKINTSKATQDELNVIEEFKRNKKKIMHSEKVVKKYLKNGGKRRTTNG